MFKNYTYEQILNFAFTGSGMKGIAHNVNTPLSAIMGRSEMLLMRLNRMKENITDDADLQNLDKCLRDISLIIDNSNRVTETIKNVMYKSISAESNDLQTLNMGKLLLQELEFLAGDMEFKHNIEKTVNISTRIPLLTGVHVHFSNSFLEIIQNCKNAMVNSEEKKFSVCLEHADDYIQVSFRDTGCGIDDENLDIIVGLLNDPPLSSGSFRDSYRGVSRVSMLLKPYNPEYVITSVPGDTMFMIKFPAKD